MENLLWRYKNREDVFDRCLKRFCSLLKAQCNTFVEALGAPDVGIERIMELKVSLANVDIA